MSYSDLITKMNISIIRRIVSHAREFRLVTLPLTWGRLTSWAYRSNKATGVLVLCQTKNDGDIIDDWVRYHLHCFGPKSVCVVDDGCTDNTLDVLSGFGDQIYVKTAFGSKSVGWGERKIENLNAVIHEYRDEYDFFLPLDADEFVGFENTVDKLKINRELCRLSATQHQGFKFASEYIGVSRREQHKHAVREITEFREAKRGYDLKKVIARSAGLISVGYGQHYIYTKDKREALTSRLSLFHYKYRGIKHLRQKCLQNIAEYSQPGVAPSRGGSQYRAGAAAIEAGFFDQWATEQIGKCEYQYSGLADLVMKLSETDVVK